MNSSLELPDTEKINHVNMDLEVLDILKVCYEKQNLYIVVVERLKTSGTNHNYDLLIEPKLTMLEGHNSLLYHQVDDKKFSVSINMYFGIKWNETRLDIRVKK